MIIIIIIILLLLLVFIIIIYILLFYFVWTDDVVWQRRSSNLDWHPSYKNLRPTPTPPRKSQQTLNKLASQHKLVDMKVTNLALILLGVIACAHTLRSDDVEVIDVDDDGSSSVSTSTPDMLPEYYKDIGLQLLNGAELKDRISQGGRRGSRPHKILRQTLRS